MQFKDVIGQSVAKDQLLQMVASDRMPHALLFVGKEGSGKLGLALAFAQYVLCQQKKEGEPCGRCTNCIKAAKWIHPDIHFSFPTVGTNVKSDQFLEQWRVMLSEHTYPAIFEWLQMIGAENKQGNINKEECLNIIRKLSLKSFEGKHKVLIMWLPEYLGKEGNRLLKLIEEPPEDTLFLLVAENAELILNTILSRCQIIRLRSLSDEQVKEGLVRRGIDENRAFQISQLADGNFNEALKLLKQIDNDNAILFLEWMRKCYRGNSVELVQWVERFAKFGREHQKFFLRYALHFMREYLYLCTTNELSGVRLTDAERQTAIKFKQIINFDQIEEIVTLLNQLSFYIERNAHPKVLFLDASLQMNNFLRNQKVSSSYK